MSFVMPQFDLVCLIHKRDSLVAYWQLSHIQKQLSSSGQSSGQHAVQGFVASLILQSQKCVFVDMLGGGHFMV